MDMGTEMGYYEAVDVEFDETLDSFVEYEKMMSREAFMDELAVEHCGDVY